MSKLEALALNHIGELDVSLLLSVEALNNDDKREIGDVILNAFQQSPRPITFLRGHTDSVRSVALSADGKTLASGSWDNAIGLWDVAAGKRLRLIHTASAGTVLSVAWSADGKALASGSKDKTIRLWDVATGKPLGLPFTGHTGTVYSVVSSADGKTLASGSGDNTIILWDVTTGKQLGSPLTGHTGTVRSVALSADGKTLASGSDDNTIRLWDIATRPSPRSSSDTWKARACRIANRNFTRVEWQQYMGDEPYRATCPEFPVPKD